MATMDAAERARLVKLGNLATNRWERDRKTLPADGVMTDRVAANAIFPNVHKLMVVGKLIGGDDGRELIRSGERIIHQHLHAIPDSLSTLRESADEIIDIYRRRHEMMAAGVAASTIIASMSESSFPGNDPNLRKFVIWNIEELVALPLSAEERGAKRNCTFCGARSGPDKVLLTCVRCKSALYCDKVCQKMDWKGEHKTGCTRGESEDGAANEVST